MNCIRSGFDGEGNRLISGMGEPYVIESGGFSRQRCHVVKPRVAKLPWVIHPTNAPTLKGLHSVLRLWVPPFQARIVGGGQIKRFTFISVEDHCDVDIVYT